MHRHAQELVNIPGQKRIGNRTKQCGGLILQLTGMAAIAIRSELDGTALTVSESDKLQCALGVPWWLMPNDLLLILLLDCTPDSTAGGTKTTSYGCTTMESVFGVQV